MPVKSTQCQQQMTASLAASLKPDYVMALGDLQYGGATLADFQTFYNKSWGGFKDKTFPVVGNHEYEDASAAGYFDYFNGIGNQTGVAGDRDKGYYALDKAGWKIIVLNSNCWAAGGCTLESPQGQWFKEQLENNPHSCQLVAWHHPRFSSGMHGANLGVQPLWEMANQYQVELVLSGHDHLYERFAQQDAQGQVSDKGPRQFIVGTGGRNLYEFVKILPNSEKRISDQFGVLSLSLEPTGYKWQFIALDQTILDSGEAKCQSS
jgi:predicted phosphodiesterase